MNIVFLTLSRINNINDHGIYTDLMRKMRNEGHTVYIVTPSERRFKLSTGLNEQDGIHILNVWTLNIQKTNVVEKGIGTILLEYQYYRAINKYLNKIKFDLILYSTPPITLTKVVALLKKRSQAFSYLLLKDIFPQNAIDLGMLKKRRIVYSYFRLKEKKLYSLSDYIGCMSPANVEYLLLQNKFIDKSKVEVCPNSIEIIDRKIDTITAQKLKTKYNIPVNAIVFIYGGNLGKPQGIDFLIDVLDSNINNKNAFFLIVGSGTEFSFAYSWFEKKRPNNAVLIPFLPRDEYDMLVSISDVGMIFLDERFTIPNYPSRLLTYLELKKPILAATDVNTDIGSIAEENNYGFWSVSGDIEHFNKNVAKFVEGPSLIQTMGEAGYNYLLKNYTVDVTCSRIMNHFSDL